METKIKWNEGDGYITATYEGSGSGSASISSDVNDGIDREQSIVVETTEGNNPKSESVSIKQFGLREVFSPSDGDFVLADGGTFNVLKVGGIEPVETYTRLYFVESTGEQYINLGYVVNENDVIEIEYIPIQLESGRLYGALDSTGNSLYWSFSNKNAYARFGEAKSVTINNGIKSNFCTMKKGSVSINTFNASLSFVAMPTTPVYLFACCDADGNATEMATFRCKRFSIKKTNGETMELVPHRRNSDGIVGMLDVINGTFYVNEGNGEFIAGPSLILPNGYSLIDAVTFNADKLFNLGIISDSDLIEIQYKRDDASSPLYLYGITNNGNTASVTAYLASNGAWRFGDKLVRPNTADRDIHRTTISNGFATHDCSALIVDSSATFTTPDSVVLGGYRDAEGTTYMQYIGKVYYIRIIGGKKLDLVPCTNSDGLEGFWDCVSESFVLPN